MPEKKKLKNRRLIISVLIIVALICLSTLIIYQYNQYNQVEKRLKAAYTSTNFQSAALYKLFSTYSEADYLFRMYAISFNPDDYLRYTQKLDTIKIVIDSLAALPINNNPIQQNKSIDVLLAEEYIDLKKQVDHLVFYAKDTLLNGIENQSERPETSSKIDLSPTDDLIDKILTESTLNNVKADTIVKKREGLFKRVFKTKDDTLISKNTVTTNDLNKMNIVLRNTIDRFIVTNHRLYANNVSNLKSTYEKLKIKEKELLFANFTLLNSLKNGIERLRQLEFDNYTTYQESDFLIYKANTMMIRNQLIIALSLMIFMVILIIGYQRQVHFYELRLIKEKDYADKIAEEKTSVLANISHEIRSPLNSLKGLVHILKNNNNDNSIDNEIITSVEHDITVINSTINDILSLSKLESDSSKIKNEPVNIYTLIEDLIGMHYYQAENKGLTVRNTNQLSKTILIHSNPFRIKQVISNLITNAIKYTDKGYIHITSEIKNKSILVVSVEDTGIGISKEEGDQIFRKYYVADNKSKAGGFGLGLYISQILADQIGGKMTFKSVVNQGTTFTFELPISNVRESFSEHIYDYSIKDLDENLEIVIIDDSKINLFFVQQLFKNRNHVHFFTNAQHALDYISAHPVDIVISDLKMPKISGWEILSFIKSNPKFAHIKTLVSTAEPLLLEYTKSEYHFDGVVNKPIKENELVYNILRN